jgi:hypothetical protein
MNEMNGLVAGMRICSLYVPGAIRIKHRELLFAGTLSIAAETVWTSPLPSAETRISHGFDAPNEVIEINKTSAAVYMELFIDKRQNLDAHF